MKKYFDKIMEFLVCSNHGKHMGYGTLIYLAVFLACSLLYEPQYACMMGWFTVFGIAGGMEYKDKCYGNVFSWVDFLCTIGPATVISMIVVICSCH